MFKNHPDKHNIKFVVLPTVMEALGFMCDVPIHFIQLIDKFREGKPHACGVKLDFSLLLAN